MMVDEILDQYHSLVKYIAKKAHYSSNTIDFDDLCQVGNIAVLRAVKAYDPSCGSGLKTFITKAVRNAIFNEAARFLGIITVNFSTTHQASLAFKLSKEGYNDTHIAEVLSKKYSRHFDADHVRDLRLVYDRKQYTPIQDDTIIDDIENDLTIKDLLDTIIGTNMSDRLILNERILSSNPVEDVAKFLQISKKAVYEREAALKEKIKRAIQESV